MSFHLIAFKEAAMTDVQHHVQNKPSSPHQTLAGRNFAFTSLFVLHFPDDTLLLQGIFQDFVFQGKQSPAMSTHHTAR